MLFSKKYIVESNNTLCQMGYKNAVQECHVYPVLV